MDAFGRIHAKPRESSTGISSIHQGPQTFELYDEVRDEVIGRVETAPYQEIVSEQLVNLELEPVGEEMNPEELEEIMSDARRAIADYYSQVFHYVSDSYSEMMDLADRAEEVLNGEETQDSNSGMIVF